VTKEICKCNGSGYVLEEGKRVLCKCIRVKRLKRYLSKLGVAKDPGEFTLPEDLGTNLFIPCPDLAIQKISGLACKMLLQYGKQLNKQVEYDCYTMSDLLPLYCGDTGQPTFSKALSKQVLVLYQAVNEAWTEKLPLVILQCLENRARAGLPVWIFTNSSEIKWPSVKDFVTTNFETYARRRKSGKSVKVF